MSKTIQLDRIIKCLKNMGLEKGMQVEVHSSLRSFGIVDGGAETVIEALQTVIGKEGTIVMPSFLLSAPVTLTEEDRQLGLTLRFRKLEENAERTGMGIIADTFRMLPDVKTGDGLFRFSAWGRDAEKFTGGLGPLIEADGWALLMGVDIYRLSSMHSVEDHLPQSIKDRFKASDEAVAVYPDEQWYLEAWAPTTKPWYKIQEMAIEKGLIQEAYIGESRCMFMKIRPLIELYKQALIDDAYGLYGLYP